MAPKSLNQELLDATLNLSNEVQTLGNRLSAKELLYKRTRRLTKVALILVAVAFLGLVIALVAISRINDVAVENATNARISCENANDARAANLKLWTLVVNTSAQDPSREHTPRDVQRSKDFQDYINKLYAPRDCNQLDRRYKIPDPPEFKF